MSLDVQRRYLSDGTTCTSYPNARTLACGAGEIAVGFYGHDGFIVDAIVIRCAPFSNGGITGPPVDRVASYYGGTGGTGFNTDHSYDCPANSYVDEVAGTNCDWAYSGGARQTAEFRYRCRDLTTQTVGGWLPANPGFGMPDGGGVCSNVTTFNYKCGSTANSSGTYIGGYIINTNSGAAFVGDGLGISCQ